MTKNEKFINRNSKNQKKIENFWSQKFRVRHARYRISTPGTRCTRLKIFLKSGYIYITDFVFQNLSKFGGGQFDPPPEILAGKVQNDPQMVQTDGKQVILTNKTV